MALSEVVVKILSVIGVEGKEVLLWKLLWRNDDRAILFIFKTAS